MTAEGAAEEEEFIWNLKRARRFLARWEEGEECPKEEE